MSLLFALPFPQQKELGFRSWHSMLNVNYKLSQLEAISPAAVTGEASRMLNTEDESRMGSQAQDPSGPRKHLRAGINPLFIS
jgi:hypothetical protein